jgi:predicted Zn finger-like uncharacterized protein
MFRVAADQLKLRGGIVRCGACTQVFDGNAALVDLATAAPVSTPTSPRQRRSTDAQAPAPAPATPEPEAAGEEPAEDPIYTLEFDRTFAPFGILPQVATDDSKADASDDGDALVMEAPAAPAAPEPAAVVEPEPEPEPEPVPEPEPETPSATPTPPLADLQPDEELVAAPAPDHVEELEEAAPAPARPAASARPAKPATAAPPLLLRESGPATVTMPLPPSAPPVAPRTPRTKAAEARAARRSKLTPTRIEPPKLRVPEPDEPEFVRRGRQRERSGKALRIAMIAGSVLLLLVLAVQLVTSFRTPLAARYPGLKPGLVSLCGVLGCRVELPAQIDQLVIDTGELTTLGGNAYTFSTQLRNQGEAVQAWPSIELTLSDADDKPLVRRVFGPRDYLPAGPLLAAGFAAHAEQPVKLHFRVEEPAPSGYHIAVFYP